METLWTHRDDLGLRQSVELGLARAASGDWVSGSLASRVRALNGWLLERSILMGHLWGEVTQNPAGNEIYIFPGFRRPSVDLERADAAITLYRTVFLVARDAAREQGEILTYTRASEGDVGIPWPILAAAAIVSVGQAVAIGYCAHQAALVVDRHLARNAELARIVQADRQALDVVRRHQDREEKAGKQLPLDDASKQVLGGLAQRQQEYAKRRETPLDSGLPTLPTFAAGAAGFSLGAIAVGALALFLVLKT